MSAVQRKKFTQRNVFYLRASPYVVLQTILYLDYRHVEWMNLNPSILTQVLSILRTRIMPKLRKESDSSGKLSAMSKKERVDVYSDRDFQVAYFFRRMDDRHSVLLKEKSLVFPSDPSLGEVKLEEEGEGNLHAPIPRATPAPGRAASVVAATGVQDGGSSAQPVRIKDSPDAQEAITSSPNASMAALSGADDNDDNALFRGGGAAEEDQDAVSMPPPATSSSTRRTRASSSVNNDTGRRSKRVRIQEDVDVKPDPSAALEVDQSTAERGQSDDQPGTEDAAIVITEEDEEKMKPKLHVKYAGFRIFGKLLVLVVEPSKRTLAAHPELFGEKKTVEIRQLSVAPRSMTPGIANNRSGSVQGRFTSLEPAERSSRNASVGRGATPLFRGATPADSEAGSTPGPMRGSVTPAPRGTSVLDNDAVGMVEGQEGEADDDGPTIGELEGIELATQMLAREEQTMGGNDIEEGD
ncbi:hypothetical protein EX895_004354 [Sporisorium graminicola]|uniref:Uncharacterized protein n=1 Tax=Sporisorium graminicola TaxID=280036 RepID=A0A4U7KQN8_9BASI|nr:hypothetical protein EX895_004354 [Sporisorium graminicola]TKY86714.1 hypothetical protein EX895_004354 [Sporisorium graminicola]